MTIRNMPTARTCISFLFAVLTGLSSGLLGAQTQPELPPLPITEESGAEPETKEADPAQAEPEKAEPESDTPPEKPLDVTIDRAHRCRHPLEGEPPAELGKKIDQVLSNKDIIGAHVGILAVAYPEGRVLYARNANQNVNPASVTKLFTAAAALALLGPEHRWTTGLYRTTGDCPPIYVKGGGDPGLEVKNLQTLADKAREAGVSCAEKLVVDVSIFDEQILPPCYEQKKSDAHWRPKIGALGTADGALNVRVFPGNYPDAAPRVTVDPDCSCLMVDSRAVTVEEVEEGHHLGVTVGVLNGKTVVRLTGQISMKKKKGTLVRRAIPQPDMYSACLLRDLLRSHGIKVKNKVVEAGRQSSS